MNKQIIEDIWNNAAYSVGAFPSGQVTSWETQVNFIEKFAELIKQAIYNEVKQGLVPEEHIDAELDIEDRCYLRGSNGGTIDALIAIKNFGVDIDE